jgi:hypothetical protein
VDFVLTRDIYPASAVAEAIEKYAPHLRVVAVRSDETETVIRVHLFNGVAPAESVVREFLNYLLDLSVRAHLSIQ